MENKQTHLVKQVILNAINKFFNGNVMDLLAHYYTSFNMSNNDDMGMFYRNTDDNRQMLLAKYDIDTLLFYVDIKQDHQFLTFNRQTAYVKGIYNVDILDLIKLELNDFTQWAFDHLSISQLNDLNKQANDKANISFYGIDYV
jgi:hypothetical protein